MSLMEHLRELRRRLVVCLVAAGVGVVISFLLAAHIWDFVVAPMSRALSDHGQGVMAVTAPLEGVITYLELAVISGVLLASPVIFHQVWGFVAPGLYRHEQQPVVILAASSSLLFLLGAAFGYFVVFRYAFPFFLSVTEGTAQPVISMKAYLGTAARLLAVFGLSFQLPVVAWFLARLGLVTAGGMARKFKYAIVGIFVVSAIITPPDVFTQLLMVVPLSALYGVGIVVAWLTQRVHAPEGRG